MQRIESAEDKAKLKANNSFIYYSMPLVIDEEGREHLDYASGPALINPSENEGVEYFEYQFA